ncbi:nuclear transport factor 2 family protein [Alteromonadaceae bacterium M269]|nr:nuclear transport factor 2 family protein [Alteromonadaceae bacterium M269]
MTSKESLMAQRPRDIAHCVSAFLQKGDLDGVVSMFHPDCKIFFPPDQPPYEGKEGARQAFEPFLEVKPEIKSDVISEVIIGDTALLRARWQVVAPSGDVLSEGESTEVAKQLENGAWVYLIDCPMGPPEL